MLKDIRGTVFIALGGRLCHFFAFVYAARCLGDAFGESSEALGWAQYLQFVLTLGLDIVAVRHLASRSIPFEKLVSGVFTSRLVIYGGVSFIWLIALWRGNYEWSQLQLWLAAVLNLFTLGMNFQWVFQGKQRMPVFTFIQAMISLGILLCFLVFFQQGDSPQLELKQVKDPEALILQLKSPSDPVAAWWGKQMSPSFLNGAQEENLNGDPSEPFLATLTNQINNIISNEDSDITILIEGGTLPASVQSFLQSAHTRYEQQKAKRLVFDFAFSDAVIPMRPGTRVGADLWLMGMCQLIASVLAWSYIRLYYRVRLFSSQWFSEIGVFVREGLPNWIFGLLYNTLITVGMLSLRKLSAGVAQLENHNDAYGTLYRLSLAVHFILAFVGSVIYTRIVIWKNEREDFFFRVALVCGAVMIVGVFCCVLVHWVHPWLYPMLFKRDVFLPAAPFMSWMLMGRFVGLSSGILVWGMLAYRKDWDAVLCALSPVIISVGLHFYLIPLYGMPAAVFLNLGGELGLFLSCLIGFLWLRKSVKHSVL